MLSEIEENSKYKWIPPKKKTWMTVPEMGNLLGLKKTGGYWLVYKKFFECREIAGQMRVNIASFEKWYANQVKYRTHKDRRKDEELEDAIITMPEMARLLGSTRSQVYGILKNSKYSYFFETIVIAEKKRITKESFQKFLDGQDHYKLDPSNDYEELSMKQNFNLANYKRKKLAKIGDRSKNGNLGYLTFDEAAFLAKVSRGMIYKWIDDGKFSSVKIGYISRVKRDEFEAWHRSENEKENLM